MAEPFLREANELHGRREIDEVTFREANSRLLALYVSADDDPYDGKPDKRKLAVLKPEMKAARPAAKPKSAAEGKTPAKPKPKQPEASPEFIRPEGLDDDFVT